MVVLNSVPAREMQSEDWTWPHSQKPIPYGTAQKAEDRILGMVQDEHKDTVRRLVRLVYQCAFYDGDGANCYWCYDRESSTYE